MEVDIENSSWQQPHYVGRFRSDARADNLKGEKILSCWQHCTSDFGGCQN